MNKVTDLIDPTTGKWDKELIEGLFWEEDVKQILTIPIRAGVEDGLAWHFDNRGIFSVKSAYHVLEDERRRHKPKQDGASSSGQTNMEKLCWQQIWKLPYLPKLSTSYGALHITACPFA